MPKISCKNCLVEFQWMPSQTKGKYCCSDCQITGTLSEKIKTNVYSRSNALTFFKRTTDYKCSCCGIMEWNGKELRLQIDHIDGNNKNNIINNLRYLCPNCHTQTDTWGTKNLSEKGKERLKEAAKLGNAIRNGRIPIGTKLS